MYLHDFLCSYFVMHRTVNGKLYNNLKKVKFYIFCGPMKGRLLLLLLSVKDV